jgi:hypothetical protein
LPELMSVLAVMSVRLLEGVPKYKRTMDMSPVPELPITIWVVVLLTNLTLSLYNATLVCCPALPI